MSLREPGQAVLQAAALSLFVGGASALAAALAIYLGSRFLPPRLPPGGIWSGWRRKRMLWGLALLLGAVGSFFAGEGVARRLLRTDLYWSFRGGDPLLDIGRLGGLTGYVGVLLLFTLGALLARRRRRTVAGPRPRRR